LVETLEGPLDILPQDPEAIFSVVTGPGPVLRFRELGEAGEALLLFR
jgi:hypothetical protein